MNIRIEKQALRIRMELEELKNFAKTGLTSLKVQFGGDHAQKLCFYLQQDSQFQLRSETTPNGFEIYVSIVSVDVMDLLELAVGPTHKKKLQKSYACGSDSVYGVNRIDFEVDVFTLRSHINQGTDSTL